MTKNQDLKKDIPYNVLLSPEHKAMLAEIAHQSGLSMGAVIRKLIQFAFAMKHDHTPICATGRTCLSPHLHAMMSTQPSRGLDEL